MKHKKDVMGKRIAITGGIGSGKSSVVKYLATQGFSTFSCDEIYAKVLSEPAYVQEMAKLFPHEKSFFNRILL